MNKYYRIAILSKHSGVANRGVETWVHEMSKRLTAKGCEVQVFSGKISWFELINFKPDIVMPCNGGLQSLTSRLLSVFCGWKVVITGHAGIGRDDKWNLLVHPHAFVSPSVRGQKWAESLWYAYGIPKYHIPHGVDLDKFNPKNKKLKLKHPVILCVAADEAYKNVDLTRKAVTKLKKGNLLILGQEKKVARDKMPEYFASSDVFTLVSDSSEAFGIVYLEALASNLPVVATNDSLRREIIGDAGILIDPHNIDEYALALDKALNKDWGDLPRQQAMKFSWDKIAASYLEVFEKLKK